MDDYLDQYNEDEYVPTREQWREEFFEYIDEYSDGNVNYDEQ